MNVAAMHARCLSAMLLLMLPFIARAGITDGLVAHFPFDGNPNDALTNGHNGMVYGAALAQDRFGRNNAAYYFNGLTDYINFTNTNVRALQNHTVAFWLKRLGNGIESPRFFLNGQVNSSVTVHQYYLEDDVNYRLNGYAEFFHTTTHALTSNTWVFIVCSYDGAMRRMYRNGSLIASNAWVVTVNTPSGSVGYIGGDNDSKFHGMLDDIRVYDRALTPGEITELYQLQPMALVITSAPTTVSYETSTCVLAGTASVEVVGYCWISNGANAATVAFPAGVAWQSPAIDLAVGVNNLMLQGTNAAGQATAALAAVTRRAATPTGLAASDGVFTNKVALAWLAAPGATSYRVLRAVTNDSGSAATIAAAVTNTVYDDTSATPGLLYYYWLVAQQNGVEGDASTPDSGYRQLVAPASIAATLGIFTNKVEVHWLNVEGATKYRVYRADSPLTNLVGIIATDVTDTNYTDTTVVPGIVYYYWVRAESAVAAGAWCGATPGYALLVANFADKKTWAMRDTKKMDTLICKQLPGPWSALLNAGWGIGVINVFTHDLVSGPFELVTKNGKKYTYKSPTATITYTENHNKRKDTYKTKLVFKFAGAIPTKPGVYLQQPTGN